MSNIVEYQELHSQNTYFPILTCSQYTSFEIYGEELGYCFCAAEKLLIVASLVCAFFVARQIALHWKTKDLRTWILCLCLISLLNNVTHYGIWRPVDRARLFFSVEILRFVIFFFICFYFCDKANSLLPNRDLFKALLQTVLVMGIFFISVIGLIMTVKINTWLNGNTKDGLNPAKLCQDPFFTFYRYFPIAVQLIFELALRQIQNRVNKNVIETKNDKINFQKSHATLNKLRKCIIVFFIVSAYLIFYDLIGSKNSNQFDDSEHDCNVNIIEGKWKKLNAVTWLLSRVVCCLSAVFIALWLFHKQTPIEIKPLEIEQRPSFMFESANDNNSFVKLPTFMEPVNDNVLTVFKEKKSLESNRAFGMSREVQNTMDIEDEIQGRFSMKIDKKYDYDSIASEPDFVSQADMSRSSQIRLSTDKMHSRKHF